MFYNDYDYQFDFLNQGLVRISITSIEKKVYK